MDDKYQIDYIEKKFENNAEQIELNKESRLFILDVKQIIINTCRAKQKHCKCVQKIRWKPEENPGKCGKAYRKEAQGYKQTITNKHYFCRDLYS
jgi:hypothetical protein